MNHHPPSPENNIRVISSFSKIHGDVRKSRCTTSIKDTNGKFATGVSNTVANFATNTAGVVDTVDTGGKFATGVNDIGGQFAAGVNDKPVANYHWYQ
jgi:hypothetical protein